MDDLYMYARLAARVIMPKRNWFPIEAWFDTRYDKAFRRMRATAEELEAQRIAARGVAGPVFSIVVPLFKTPIGYLHDMVRSVLGQTYPNFELVLVNASPEIVELRAEVDRYAAEDARVKVVTLEGNYGITENTNRGIEVATGDFICFMDHDDWIEPDTLFEYAAAVREHGDIDLLYCDEDLVEKEQSAWRHRHPLFKPDFSPELLLCKNYVVHLLTVRRSLIDALPTPGSEFDGAQDYNMTFMASERARRIHHVSRVLYHWRMSDTSTAANSAAKPYGKRAYRLSAQRHLERLGVKGFIVGSGIVNIHTIWFDPRNDVKVSVIVASATTSDNRAFDAFIEAFRQVNTHDNIELVIVHGEGDSLPADEKDCAVVFKEAPQDANLPERFNVGAGEASGDILVFADAGCQFVTPEPIEQLIGMHELPGVGVVAPKTLYADYTVKAYGIGVSGEGIVPLYRGYPLDYPGDQCNMRAFQNASAVGYQGISIRRSLFEEIGGFDVALAPEIASADLCHQVRLAGKRVVATCGVNLITDEQPPERPYDESSGRPDYPQTDAERFFAKWPQVKSTFDPYRSPLLDQASSYPVIRYEG